MIKQRQRQRLASRNKDVKSLFSKLCKKHPQWRKDAIISEVADAFYLSEVTIKCILKEKGIYKR